MELLFLRMIYLDLFLESKVWFECEDLLRKKRGKKKSYGYNTSISIFPHLLNEVSFALVGWHSSNNLINKLKIVEVINLQREIKERKI